MLIVICAMNMDTNVLYVSFFLKGAQEGTHHFHHALLQKVAIFVETLDTKPMIPSCHMP